MLRSLVYRSIALLLLLAGSHPVDAQNPEYQAAFFILGSVQHPGKYPCTQRLTVLHAVVIAGGYYRASDAGLRLERDAAIAAGDLKLLHSKRLQALARSARLSAELSDSDDIPPESGSTQNPFLQAERSIMQARRKSVLDQIKHLDNQIALSREEIVSLQQNIEAQTREAASIQRELAEVRGLIERGLAATIRQYLPERSLAQIESKQHELQTYIVRAKQNIEHSEQEKTALADQRQTTLLSELQQTQSDLGEIDKRIETTRELLLEAEGMLPGRATLPSDLNSLRPVYQILRASDQGFKTIEAAPDTVIEPGDVVRVQMPTSWGVSTAGDAPIR